MKHKEAASMMNTSKERKERQRLYGRKEWEQRRQLQLAREPWCAECLLLDRYTPATDVHHVIDHRGDPLIFATSPLQSLCHACHTRMKMKKGRGHKKDFAGGALSSGGIGAKKSPLSGH